MYDRFTDRARKVMAFARVEAERLNHDYIGTEHILLGLIKEGRGIGAQTLQKLDIELNKARAEVEKLVKPAPDKFATGQIPFTPRGKKVLEFAIDEARGLDHSYVGTEHILLGLLREQEGLASQILNDLGLKIETVRAEVLKLIGAGGKEDAESAEETEVPANPPGPAALPKQTFAEFAKALLAEKVGDGRRWLSECKTPRDRDDILIPIVEILTLSGNLEAARKLASDSGNSASMKFCLNLSIGKISVDPEDFMQAESALKDIHCDIAHQYELVLLKALAGMLFVQK